MSVTLPTRCRTHEGGFSLVEVLVVLVLLGVIGGVVTNALVQGLRTTERADDRISASLDLQRAIERIGRELRVADQLLLPTTGTSFRNEVGADVVRGGEQVSYRYYLVELADGSVELREDVQRYDADGTLISSRDGLFVAEVANAIVSDDPAAPAGTPLFTYYVRDPVTGQLDEAPCDDPSDDACAFLHTTAVQVEIRLERQLRDGTVLPLETIVNIRSARFSVSGAEEAP